MCSQIFPSVYGTLDKFCDPLVTVGSSVNAFCDCDKISDDDDNVIALLVVVRWNGRRFQMTKKKLWV